MPCLEELPKAVESMIITNNIVRIDVDMEEVPEAAENQLETNVVRELTQTDRLNNHLLKSFLERMNAGTDGLAEHFSADSTTKFQTEGDEVEKSDDFEA